MYDFVIVGLENQASRGTFSRHSVAGRFVDYLNNKFSDGQWIETPNVLKQEIVVKNYNILLLKTNTGKLHTCGEVLIAELLNFADPKRIIIVYDEALLDIGDTAVYSQPMLNITHMGLKSLVRELGTAEFIQVGIGIGIIPKDKSQWDDFFNAELPIDLSNLIKNQFSTLEANIFSYISSEMKKVKDVSSNQMLIAQLENRSMNLSIAPTVVQISKKDAKQITRNVNMLLRLISEIANKYAQACNEENNPDENPLVQILERGIPEKMIPLVRSSAAHIDNLSFDIQSGKLIEINAAPMPPLTVMNLADDYNIVGDKLTLEILTKKVVSMANRGNQSVLIVDEIGGLKLGKTGWISEVQKYLSDAGINTIIGNINDVGDASVVWGNLTWMTPDRIAYVVGDTDAAIFPSPRNFLFTSKWFLTLLHDEYAQEVLGISKGYQDMISTFVPKTFALSDSIAQALLDTNTNWYMKPCLSSGGRGGGKLANNKSHKKVDRPAVIQEWSNPYSLNDDDYKYDIRICVYQGDKSPKFVWTARVWYAAQTLQRPMDSLVVYEN